MPEIENGTFKQITVRFQGRSTKDVAQAYWDQHIKPLLDRNQKVALLYSANNVQAEALYEHYEDGNIKGLIQGANQAQLFRHITDLIIANNAQANVHILPIPTCKKSGGGEMATPTMVKKSLKNVAKHLGEGWHVLASMDPSKKTHYSIGGGVNKRWPGSPQEKMVTDTLNDFHSKNISNDHGLEDELNTAYEEGKAKYIEPTTSDDSEPYQHPSASEDPPTSSGTSEDLPTAEAETSTELTFEKITEALEDICQQKQWTLNKNDDEKTGTISTTNNKIISFKHDEAHKKFSAETTDPDMESIEALARTIAAANGPGKRAVIKATPSDSEGAQRMLLKLHEHLKQLNVEIDYARSDLQITNPPPIVRSQEVPFGSHSEDTQELTTSAPSPKTSSKETSEDEDMTSPLSTPQQ